MAFPASPYVHPPGSLTLARGRQQARVQEQLAADQQEGDRRAHDLSNLNVMRIQAIRNGALPNSLPEIHAGMSHADMEDANARIAPLAAAHLPFSGPIGGSARQGLSPEEASAAVAARKMSQPDQPGTVTEAKLQAAAGTGQTVQTPYGTGSSRPGTWLDRVADAGGKDWQKQVVEKYPQIGVSGSPENAAFVSAIQQAHQTPNFDGEKDPMKIADFVTSVNSTSPTGLAAPKTIASAAAQGLPTPGMPATALGSAVGGAAQTAMAPPPLPFAPDTSTALGTGKAAGQTVRSNYENLMEQPDSPRSLFNKGASWLQSGADVVRGFLNPDATPAPSGPLLANHPEAITAPVTPVGGSVGSAIAGLTPALPWDKSTPSAPFSTATSAAPASLGGATVGMGASGPSAPPLPPTAPFVTPAGMGASGAAAGATTDPNAILTAFSRNPEEEQWQKKLQTNPPSMFQTA